MTGEGRKLLGQGYAGVALAEADPTLSEEELSICKAPRRRKLFALLLL